MSEKSSKTLVMKYGGTSVGVGMPNAVQIVKIPAPSGDAWWW